MDLIEFQDLPNTDTPINAENLNYNYKKLKNANTYSEEEQVIGMWFGKNLYRKVIDFGALPNTDYKEVQHNISNIENIITVKGIVKTSTQYFYETNMAGTNSMFSNSIVNIRANNTSVQISTTTDYSVHTAYVILEYTKTTD